MLFHNNVRYHSVEYDGSSVYLARVSEEDDKMMERAGFDLGDAIALGIDRIRDMHRMAVEYNDNTLTSWKEMV